MSTTHTTIYVLIAIVMLFGLSLITRILPFIFGKFLADNLSIRKLSFYLPATIMLLLVIFELRDLAWQKFPAVGVPQLISLVAVSIIHLWKKNMFLSLFCGMVIFFTLRHFHVHF